jgi:drug/metabolite transporter (DMT)-like permease
MPATADGRPYWLAAAPFLFLGFWSSGFAFAKLGLAHAEPLTCLVLRYVAVLVVLAPVLAVLRPALPPVRVLLHAGVVGLLIQGVYFGLSYVAMNRDIAAGAVALIVSLQPILVGLLAPGVVGERVSLLRWAGLGLGLVGAALVILARSTVEVLDAWAVVAAVGALAGITAGTLWEKRFGVAAHPMMLATAQFVAGLVLLVPGAWWLEGFAFTPHPELWLSVGYLVVANSLISLTLLLAMIRHGEVARVSSLFFLVPPTAALIAWGVIGEVMPPAAWLGMVVAAAGVALAVRAAAGRPG